VCVADGLVRPRSFMRMRNPPHPGRVVREYLGTVTDTANHLGVTRVALSRMLNGSAGISAGMALKLADALGTSPELWLGMQMQYDLWQASQRRRRKSVTPFFVEAGRRHDTAVESHSSQSAR
jgi:antitoxin HigA-1